MPKYKPPCVRNGAGYGAAAPGPINRQYKKIENFTKDRYRNLLRFATSISRRTTDLRDGCLSESHLFPSLAHGSVRARGPRVADASAFTGSRSMNLQKPNSTRVLAGCPMP